MLRSAQLPSSMSASYTVFGARSDAIVSDLALWKLPPHPKTPYPADIVPMRLVHLPLQPKGAMTFARTFQPDEALSSWTDDVERNFSCVSDRFRLASYVLSTKGKNDVYVHPDESWDYSALTVVEFTDRAVGHDGAGASESAVAGAVDNVLGCHAMFIRESFVYTRELTLNFERSVPLNKYVVIRMRVKNPSLLLTKGKAFLDCEWFDADRPEVRLGSATSLFLGAELPLLAAGLKLDAVVKSSALVLEWERNQPPFAEKRLPMTQFLPTDDIVQAMRDAVPSKAWRALAHRPSQPRIAFDFSQLQSTMLLDLYRDERDALAGVLYFSEFVTGPISVHGGGLYTALAHFARVVASTETDGALSSIESCMVTYNKPVPLEKVVLLRVAELKTLEPERLQVSVELYCEGVKCNTARVVCRPRANKSAKL